MRYAADDYCFNAELVGHGFWESQINSYRYTTNYNSNRFSVMFLVAASELFGLFGLRYIPLFSILLWVLGSALLFREGLPLFRQKPILLEVSLLAVMSVFFSIYLAPNLFQNLYWRSGMLTYLTPLVTNVFLFGFIIRLIKRESNNLGSFVLVAVLAFFSGGFSEAALLMQIGLLGFLFIFLLGKLRETISARRSTFWVVIWAGAGSFFALCVQLLSPTNALRLQPYQSQPDILSSLWMSLDHGFDFIRYTIQGLPLPMAIIFLAYFCVSLLHGESQGKGKSYSVNQLIGTLIIILLAGYLLVVITMLPSAIIQNAYPDPRTLFVARFLIIVAVICLAFLSAITVKIFVRACWLRRSYLIPALIILCGVFVYPLRATLAISQSIPLYAQRADIWDQRDQKIHLAAEEGVHDVVVNALDSIGVHELNIDPGFWVNRCAAVYYGVDTISAIEE